jgi:hypothetical protein
MLKVPSPKKFKCICVPPKIHERVKEFCYKKGLVMGTFVGIALEEVMKQYDTKEKNK